MLNELDVAKHMIISYLNNNINADSLSALFAIQQGDKEELLEHFEELEKKVDSRYLKQHFRGLQDNLRKYLNLESKGEVNE